MQYRQVNNEPLIKIRFLLLPSGIYIVQYYGLLICNQTILSSDTHDNYVRVFWGLFSTLF